jgi:hypothetical protein
MFLIFVIKHYSSNIEKYGVWMKKTFFFNSKHRYIVYISEYTKSMRQSTSSTIPTNGEKQVVLYPKPKIASQKSSMAIIIT